MLQAIRAQLASASLRCPFAPAPAAGAADRGFTDSTLSDELVTFLEAHPPAAAASGGGGGGGGEPPLTAPEVRRFTNLGVVNSARLRGELAHVCPRGACQGVFLDIPPPAPNAPGVRMECVIGRRPGSSVPPCPASICAFCGEMWDPLHKGKACGRWREEAPPPAGIKLCPWCKVPGNHFHGHGCHHMFCANVTCRKEWVRALRQRDPAA